MGRRAVSLQAAQPVRRDFQAALSLRCGSQRCPCLSRVDG